MNLYHDNNNSCTFLFVLSSSGPARPWLQRACGEKPGQTGASHFQRFDRLAGGHTGQDLSAALRAAASQ